MIPFLFKKSINSNVDKMSSILWGVFALCALMVLPHTALATVETFTSAGASTWTAPADVYSVTVETWGGGGGSGGGTNTGLPGGSGGGGGAYASKVISVTPGLTYNYTVGAAGAASGGAAGGDSFFTGDDSVQAKACGGTSGADNGGTAGAGGTVACSDGTTEFAGGAGAAGAGTDGGGGGESASASAAGNDAVGTAGGTGTAGTDGSAGQALGVAGVAGNNPGAGAGGSGRRSGGSEAGAAGGVGQVKLTYTATPPVISQTKYIFLNDNGTTTDTYTQSHSAATSTSISNVKKGEKLIARIQIDNTGPATSTKSYRLQWENNTDAAGTWTDLGTTTQIRWALSEKAAMPGRSGQVPLTSRQVGTCTTTTTFVSGYFVAGTATSSMLSLGPTKCTELAYAIETSGATLGKTYRLRLVMGSTTTALDAYTEYPTFTIESAQTLRYSKEGRGGYSTTTLDATYDVGQDTSMAIGADGFPVISYYDATNSNLNFAKCNNVSCSSYATSSLDGAGAFSAGQDTSIAIGSDGFPVMSYYGGSSDLVFVKCNDIACSSVATSSLDWVYDNGSASSIAIGSDGFPVIAYRSFIGFGTTKLNLAKCNNVSCSSYATSSLDWATSVSNNYTSLTIGSDGFPVISYINNLAQLVVAKCNNISCSSFSTSSPDTGNFHKSSIVVGSDGLPVIVVRDSSNLNFLKCSNLSCSSGTITVLDATVGTFTWTSTAIGSDGFPVIAYYNSGSNNNLVFAKCNNVSCSSWATSSLDTADDVGDYPSLAIGSDGFPVISYYNTTNTNLNFVKCYDLYCRDAASSTANLTRTNSDLSRFLDDDGYTNVATANDVYDSLAAGTSTRLAYLFTKKNTNNTDPITPTWEGQVSKATTTYLKIYNNSTGAWEDLDSDTAPTPNVDFVLTGTQSTNLSNYYDASNVVYFRVETGTTTASTTLKTDYINIFFPLPTLAQTAYIFTNDNGTTTDTYTQSHSAATSTSISSVKKGEKLIARIQIDNTGGATSTASYRLQWENQTDAEGTWNDLGTTTQIRWALSEKAAMPGRGGGVPLTSKQVGNCTTTTTFSSGLFVAGTATSTMLSLGPTKCTELAYAIETSGATLNKIYRLRLVTGSTATALDAYTKYPTFTIESAQTLRYSKEARGIYGTTTLDSLRDVGDYTAIAIGADGFPVIAYQDFTLGYVNFAKCNNTSCSSYATSSLDTTGTVGQDLSIAIGSDGFPVISYYDAGSNNNLKFIKCDNIPCSSFAVSALDTGGTVGQYTAIAIGADGFPVISYYAPTNGELNFAKCNNLACSSVATSSLDTQGNVGQYSSLAIGSDGFPVISYYDDAPNNNLNLAKCSNTSCTSLATSSLDWGGTVGQYSSIAIGADGFPVIAYYDNSKSNLNFAKCNNISCTSVATSSLDTNGNVGQYTAIAIGADGFPAIAYYDVTNLNLNFAKCKNVSCSSWATSSLDTGGQTGIGPMLSIGADGFPVIAYYGNDTTRLDLNFLKCNDMACSTEATSTRLSYLSTTNSDLSRYLDDDGYTNVGTANDVYDSLAAGTSTRLAYLFSKKNTNNTSIITPTWEGQVSLATTTYLKIWNNSSSAWEVFDTDAAPTPNTDFVLTGTQSTNLSNYYDASNVVYFRVETGTTTASTTLKTDYFNLSFTSPTLAQTSYIFLNDNGTTTDTYTQSHSAATSTSISNVKKGEKLIARIQIDNTGQATSTAQYRLQWENYTDAQGTWTDLGTTTQIRWALSEKAAMPGRSGQVPLTSKQVGTCTTTTQFVAGFFVAGTATSSMLSLGPTKCTELAYAIETSGATLNKTYRLRLVTGSTTTALDNYTQYPTFSIETAQTIRYSKEARGGYSTTTLDSLGNAGQYSSLAIGSDGFPVIAYYDGTLTNLNFVKCNNISCSSYATSSLDWGGDVGQYPSIAIGSDGFPVISYYDGSNFNLNFVKCGNIACSSYATSSIDWGGDLGQYTSITIGSDGFPVISYRDWDAARQNLNFAKCNNLSCSSVATSSLDWGGDVGEFTSIAIGSDGFPVMAYYDLGTNDNLNFVKCNDISCTSSATSSLDTTGDVGSHTSIAIGSDGFPVIAYHDNDASRINVKFIKCRNISCSSKTTSALDGVLIGGYYTSIAIGSDGFPVITYHDDIKNYLIFAKCNNVSCSSFATSSLDTGGDVGQYTSLAIGSDGFPVISYFDTSNTNLNFLKCNDLACSTAATSTRLSYLATTNADLSRFLDDDGYTNVATANDVYDSLAAGTSTRLAYLFTKKGTSNTLAPGATWEGQVSKATTTYLKVYNNSTGLWETIASNASPSANADFTLSGTAATAPQNYYDANTVVYFRVETGTTTASTTLKTDYITIGNPALAQTAYIFLNDNGTTTDTYTQSHSAATSTSISNVKKGEKLIARIQIDNTGTATSTAQYRLQWENYTDAQGTWTDLGTTTQIRWALSEKAAMPGRSGQVPLTSRQVGTCTTTTTFVSGFFVAGTATSSMLSLGPTKCTELAYAIETSGATLNKTYRLRLVTGSTTTALDNYTQYPTFSIESAQTIRYSKEARGGYATTTLDDGLASAPYPSIAISSDGFPVISYYDNSVGNLNFVKCNNTSCSSYVSSSLDGANEFGPNVGQYSSVTIGSDGFPVISYQGTSELSFAKCGNTTCTSVATSSLDAGIALAEGTSIAIGSDGFPVISYYDSSDLKFAKCNNISCSSVATSTLDWIDTTGQYSSIAIGSDGFPVIAYHDVTNFNLNIAKCNNITCSSYATSSLDSGGQVGQYPSIAIGSDGFPVIAYRYWDGSKYNLKFAKCNNISCSSTTLSTLDQGGGIEGGSLAIGSDGFPVISYYDLSNTNLNFAKCNNISCSSYATSSLDTGGDVGKYSSLAVGAEGFPVISYYSTSNFALRFLKCNDLACSTTATSTRLSYLSATTTDLSRYLDDDGYTNVATADNLYDQLSAGTSTRLAYLFTKKHTNNTDVITPTWEGQVSKATTTYLKLFNHAAGTWETLDTDAGPTPNVDFVLTGTQSANLANYYDGSNVVYLRVETGTTTASTTLKTDQMTITLGSTDPTLSISYYRWREDNGTEAAATYSTAENTALGTSSNMYLGDRKRLRFSVANTGGGSATGYTYRLEHASSSCTAWYAVPSYNTQSTQEWVIDQSQWIPDGAATTHSSGMSVPSGKSFVAGQVRLNLNQTAAHTLTTSEYTEIEFAFRSTAYVTPNLPYCFRLTNAGSTTFFSYVVTPRIVVNPGSRPEYGGGGAESSGTGAARTGGGMGGGSGSEGSGSGPAQTGGGMGGGGGDSG